MPSAKEIYGASFSHRSRSCCIFRVHVGTPRHDVVLARLQRQSPSCYRCGADVPRGVFCSASEEHGLMNTLANKTCDHETWSELFSVTSTDVTVTSARKGRVEPSTGRSWRCYQIETKNTISHVSKYREETCQTGHNGNSRIHVFARFTSVSTTILGLAGKQKGNTQHRWSTVTSSD